MYKRPLLNMSFLYNLKVLATSLTDTYFFFLFGNIAWVGRKLQKSSTGTYFCMSNFYGQIFYQ